MSTCHNLNFFRRTLVLLAIGTGTTVVADTPDLLMELELRATQSDRIGSVRVEITDRTNPANSGIVGTAIALGPRYSQPVRFSVAQPVDITITVANEATISHSAGERMTGVAEIPLAYRLRDTTGNRQWQGADAAFIHRMNLTLTLPTLHVASDEGPTYSSDQHGPLLTEVELQELYDRARRAESANDLETAGRLYVQHAFERTRLNSMRQLERMEEADRVRRASEIRDRLIRLETDLLDSERPQQGDRILQRFADLLAATGTGLNALNPAGWDFIELDFDALADAAWGVGLVREAARGVAVAVAEYEYRQAQRAVDEAEASLDHTSSLLDEATSERVELAARLERVGASDFDRAMALAPIDLGIERLQERLKRAGTDRDAAKRARADAVRRLRAYSRSLSWPTRGT